MSVEPTELRTVPAWRWKWRKRWHNLFCAECRPCYTFWHVRAIPLSERQYDCECCGFRVCMRKSPGIGYYCGRCLHHWTWQEDVGRPNARHATFADLNREVAEDHLSIRRAHAAGWRFVDG